MDKKCINCRYFKQGSVGPTRIDYIWGDCMKANKRAWKKRENENSFVSFTWADGCCEHFEPKKSSDGESKDGDSE